MKRIVLNEFYAVEDLGAFAEDFRCPDCAGRRGHHSDPSCPTLRASAVELAQEVKRYAAQKDFVHNKAKASAYIGGLGSGKTFAGIARALAFSQQPVVEGSLGPRGIIAAVTFPSLEDNVYPVFFEMMDGAGLWKTGKMETSWSESRRNAKLVANCGCPNKQGPPGKACKHYALIRFRSLDRPNWLRGQEVSWFFIDEGRHLTGKAWEVLWARLRQKGYQLAGWVASTPNGFDWQWEKFHPDSPLQLPGAIWFGASTYENADNLPDDYVKDLLLEYEGAFLRQEVFGEFIGVTEGAVFFSFRPERAITQVPYRPDLELYSAWDFGMGDLGVCSFHQVDYTKKALPDGSSEYVPVLRGVGCIEAKDWTSAQWANAFKRYCDDNFGGRRPEMNAGDPAGKQRAPGKKTSIIQDLYEHGIVITTPPRRPQDFAVRILNNMMEGDRVVIDAVKASRLGAAVSSHHWPVDDNGIRKGNVAVHDWTSHYCDGLRYLATLLFSFHTRREPKVEKPPPGPGTVGHLFGQILDSDPTEWLGREASSPIEDWTPGVVGWVDGRLVTVPE